VTGVVEAENDAREDGAVVDRKDEDGTKAIAMLYVLRARDVSLIWGVQQSSLRLYAEEKQHPNYRRGKLKSVAA
jgi:hypothetical protein